MKLIVGLGNPGSKYVKTRHNIGFMVVEALAQDAKLKFQSKAKLKADVARGAIDSQEIILAKPTTYMNLSGFSVAKLLSFYNLKPADLWVIYDDVDIEFGYLKIKPFGSAAGHKGATSIIEQLATQKFPRFRVGIKLSTANEKDAQYHKKSTARFVVQPFSQAENKILRGVIQETVDAVKLALAKGLPTAMNNFN
ncbi:MAG: aminoacyl-tRNA hydrolase [Patescibacteria group bacterium]|nr:aminoacyl-tRNA hydrolase [Patescibacteria group bacterium]